MGELDDWTATKDCVRTMPSWVELVTYPGAHHAFNVQIFKPGRMMFRHWTEYNAEVAQDASRRIRAFLAEYLEK